MGAAEIFPPGRLFDGLLAFVQDPAAASGGGAVSGRRES